MSRQVLLAEYTTIKQSVWLSWNKAQSFSTKRRSRKRGRKKKYKVEFPLVLVVGGVGYERRSVGVSDCKVDGIIYSAMVNIPWASRHGQFLDV